MLSKSLRQVRPRPNHNISHVQKIQSLLEQELETNPEFVETFMKGLSADDRTQVYESAVVLVALSGGKVTRSSYNSIIKKDFAKKAKDWAEKSVPKEYFDLLLEYYSNLGYPISKLGKFQDFLQDSITQNYYRIMPKSFQFSLQTKENTADCVLILDASASELTAMLKEIAKLSEKEQVSRATTQPDGKVTISDDKGKQISFYQVSLKKGEGGARIGKVGSFIKAIHDPIKQTEHFGWTEDDLLLLEFNLMDRMRDLVSTFKNVATKGIKVFTTWAQNLFGKVVSLIKNIAQAGVNRRIKNKRDLTALSNDLIREVGLQKLTEQAIPAKDSIVKKTTALKRVLQQVNDNHKANVDLVKKLNDRPKMKIRAVPPILFIGEQEGLYNVREAELIINDILNDFKKNKSVNRDKFKFAVTLASNNAGNIAINEILKGVEKNIGQYENLVESLFAFVSTLEGEAKFGNTALPLVICYGGLDGYNKNLGTRDDFTKTNQADLLQKGKSINDFYVVVIEITKVRNKLYNAVNVHLCTGFKDDKGKPNPVYQTMGIANSSGSNFSTKIEINTITSQNKVNSWK